MNDSSSNDSDSSFDWNDPDINPSVRKAAIAFRDDAINTLKKLRSKPKKSRRRKSSIKKLVSTIKKMTRKGGKRKNKTKRKKKH